MSREVVGYDLEVRDRGASETVSKVDKRTSELLQQVQKLDSTLKAHQGTNARVRASLASVKSEFRQVTQATSEATKGNVALSAQAMVLSAKNKTLAVSLTQVTAAQKAAAAAAAHTAGQVLLAGQAASLASGRMAQMLRVAGRFGPALAAVAVSIWLVVKAAQAVAGALISATKSGMAFERRLAEIRTISEKAEFPLQSITKTVVDMAGQFGVGIQSGSKALYQAISSGATTAAEASAVLSSAVKLSIGGLAELPTTVDALTSALNAYKLQGLTATQAADAMFTTVRYGKTTMQELAGQLGNVVTFGAGAGVTFDELNAGITTMTLRGTKTQKAVIQMRQALAAIIDPTEKAKDEAKRLGIEFDTMALKSKGLLGFLREVMNSANYTSGSFSRLFGNVRALNFVNGVMIDQGYELEDQLTNVANKSGAADAATAIMQETTAQLVDRILALKDALVGLFGKTIAESEGLKFVLQQIATTLMDMVEYAQTEEFDKTIDKWVDRLRIMLRVMVNIAKASLQFLKSSPVGMVADGVDSVVNKWDRLKHAHNEQQNFSAFNMQKRIGTIPADAPYTPLPVPQFDDGFNIGESLSKLDDLLAEAGGKKRAAREALGGLGPLLPPEEANWVLARRLTDEELQAARDRADLKERELQKENERKAKGAAAARAYARELRMITQDQLRGQKMVSAMHEKEIRQIRDKARALQQSEALSNTSMSVKHTQRLFLDARGAGLQRDRGAVGEKMQGATQDLAAAKTAEQSKAALAEFSRYFNQYQDLTNQLNTVDTSRLALLKNMEKQREKNAEDALATLEAQKVGASMMTEAHAEEASRNEDAARAAEVRLAIDSKSIALKNQAIAKIDEHIEALQRQRAAAETSATALAQALKNAGSSEAAKKILDEMREFVAAWKSLTGELNNADRERARVVKSVTTTIGEAQRQQVEIQSIAAKGLINIYSDILQEMIKHGANSKEIMKKVVNGFVQMLGAMLTKYVTTSIAMNAVKKTEIVANAGVAGSAVGAGTAEALGPLALAVAPPLIAAMVAIIMALTSTFHEGGMVGAGGRRTPLGLGPSEAMAIVREGEMIIPTARVKNGGSSREGGTTININPGFLSNPSNASFGRMLDNDVIPGIRRSLGSGRATLNDKRAVRRSRA